MTKTTKLELELNQIILSEIIYDLKKKHQSDIDQLRKELLETSEKRLKNFQQYQENNPCDKYVTIIDELKLTIDYMKFIFDKFSQSKEVKDDKNTI